MTHLTHAMSIALLTARTNIDPDRIALAVSKPPRPILALHSKRVATAFHPENTPVPIPWLIDLRIRPG